ncbi:MAG: RNA methyltransferase [Bacteroidota bacterium]
MAHDITITSLQNPWIKKLRVLKEKSRERKKTGRFVIEGHREITLAQKGGYTIETIFLCPEIMMRTGFGDEDLATILVSKTVYERIAHRGSTEGVLAIAKAKEHGIQQLQLKENPLILVAEAPEKPGNIGALLRTADAANLDAVCIANPKGDLYNPNIVRSSVGSIFTTPVAVAGSEEIIHFLKQQQLKIYCAALSAAKDYIHCDFKGGAAIVVGTESQGLSEIWLEQSDQNIRIPMRGAIDSMNVSVSAAILIFEALRQREYL